MARRGSSGDRRFSGGHAWLVIVGGEEKAKKMVERGDKDKLRRGGCLVVSRRPKAVDDEKKRLNLLSPLH